MVTPHTFSDAELHRGRVYRSFCCLLTGGAASGGATPSQWAVAARLLPGRRCALLLRRTICTAYM